MKNCILPAAFLAIGLSACSKPPASATTAPAASPSPASRPSPPSSPAGTAPKPAETSSTETATTKPVPPTVPDSLKTDAYEYYGMASEKPQKVTITMEQNGTKTYPGTHTITLVSASPDKAVFQETQTGAPSGDNNQTVSLTKDGIFIDAVDPYKLKTPHVLQLPTGLTPGKTWPYTIELDMGGSTLKVTSIGKVVGPQTIKTKSGPMQALYVTGDGAGTYGSSKVQLKDDWWYVKGKGLMKSKDTLTIGGKKTVVGIESAG